MLATGAWIAGAVLRRAARSAAAHHHHHRPRWMLEASPAQPEI
jgi:hypothetical protein